MTRLLRLALSSIGSKVVVAVTGVLLAGFVVFHMLGNLQVFEGADRLNAYAAFLREMPILLWSARGGLLVLALVHVGVAAQLAVENRRARPVPYAARDYRRASVASRTMALTGSLLFLFILFHLLHLTGSISRASGMYSAKSCTHSRSRGSPSSTSRLRRCWASTSAMR
jgi:succinate dehydrogenase / fumarate reductase cytochrome b subunit